MADGRHALSASNDRTLRLWDLKSGRSIRQLEGHTDRVSAVAVTPDGRRTVSASRDRTLRLWDLESGAEIAIFTADISMSSCTFARDGRTIVAGDGFGRLHFLRLVELDETKSAFGDTKISFCTAMNKLALQRILKFYSTPSSRVFFTHFCSGCYLPSLASEFWIIQSIAKMLRVTQSVGDRSSWIGARSQVGEGITRNDGNSLHFSKRLSERLSAMLREDSVKTSLY
jgi:WD40 repeat protein